MPTYGALPPADKSWMVGRTTETIHFVQDAEAWLLQPGHEEADRNVIHSAIRAIKHSKANLTKPLTVAEYLTVPDLPGM